MKLSTCLALSGLLLLPLTGHAALTTWGAAQNTVDASDIFTAGGVVLEARSGLAHVAYLEDTPTLDTTTGGILFDATNFLGKQFAAEPIQSLLAGKTTGDADYDSLIGNGTIVDGATLGNGSTNAIGNYEIAGLTVGNDYLVQIWYTDVRDIAGFDAREMVIDGSVTIASGTSAPADDFGQYAIGTFTADSITQLVSINHNGTAGRAGLSGLLVVDVSAPYVTLSTPSDTVTTPYTIDLTFSEDVTGLDAIDFVVSNGLVSSLAPASGPASAYTILITPTASGVVTVDLPAATVLDNDGHNLGNTASNTLNTIHVPPGSEQADPTLSTLAFEPVFETYIVDVVFTEDVTGLESGDFVVENGTASNVLPASGPASAYTVEITPIATGYVTVTLPSFAAFDVDGDNLPNLESNALVTDFFPPSIPVATLYNPLSGSLVNAPYTIDVEFTEDVVGLEARDFSVTNGTATLVSPATGPDNSYTVLITPIASGSVSVTLPADSVTDTDTENQMNPESNTITATFLPAGTFTSGVIDLSGRDVLGLGLGVGESSGTFASPKTFGPTTDFSMDNIPWSNGGESGTFDLSLVATGSTANILRGGKGAFGTDTGLLAPGTSITLDSLVISDLQGDLASSLISNIKIIAVYLGNATANDGATINGIAATGGAGGDTFEDMRNEIAFATSATILGTETGDGYTINGLEIIFDTAPGGGVTIVNSEFNVSNEFVVDCTGLSTSVEYELRRSSDGITFTPVAGSAKTPASASESFIDAAPAGTTALYQLWTTP